MKKKIILFLVVLGLISGLVGVGILKYTYSKGNRAGKLVKLSKKGFLPKTWEGTLDLGSGDKLTWDFSIHDNKVGEALAKETGKMVNLHYRELLWRLFYDTPYDIVSWDVENSSGDGTALLCRFVEVLRNNKGIVEQIRPMLESYDPGLLQEIRNCQR